MGIKMKYRMLKWMGCPTVSLYTQYTEHLSCRDVSGRALKVDCVVSNYSRYIAKGKSEHTDRVTRKSRC